MSYPLRRRALTPLRYTGCQRGLLRRWTIASRGVVSALAMVWVLQAAVIGESATAADALPSTTSEADARHLLDRLAFGAAPGDLQRVQQIGARQWIDEQLHPERIAEPEALSRYVAAQTRVAESPAALYARLGPEQRRSASRDRTALQAFRRERSQVLAQAQNLRLMRAVASPAQLQEVLVDFWFNHFNVYAGKSQVAPLWMGAYEREAIRPHVLGRFRELLGATAEHPAMLLYLDNARSSRPPLKPAAKGGINENYARELMELHTLGVDGGYQQADVLALARILTGWTYLTKKMIEQPAAPAFVFAADRHDKGAKRWRGQSFAAGGGREEGVAALDRLARDPATARHIARRLVQYFIADEPPPAAVDRVAQRFLKTDGDLRETLRALFESPEFWSASARGAKFKTPYQYVVSVARSRGDADRVDPRKLVTALRDLGQPLYGCVTPDGYSNVAADWLSPGGIAARVHFAVSIDAASRSRPVASRPPTMAGDGAMADDDDDARAPSMRAADAGDGAVEAPTTAGPRAISADALIATVGARFSAGTLAAARQAPPALRAPLLWASPEFQRR